MRPDYDGVKFYGKGDMANSIQLEKADAIIFSFDETSNIQKWLIYAVFYSSRVLKNAQLVTD